MHEGLSSTGHEPGYARIESVILDLQLSASSVRRANACLDLETVKGIRRLATKTLANSDRVLAQVHADPRQAQRFEERRQSLIALLSVPAPIEQLARTLRVG